MLRTVCGDISETIVTGNILTHEHVMCASFDMLHMWGDKWLNLAEFEAFAVEVYKSIGEKYGVSLIVDATPCDLGRDAALIKRVSQHSGVHLMASTGFYFYPSQLTSTRSPRQLAEICIDECKNGIGETGIRPGILKCAIDREGMTADCRKRLAAMGIVQRETGLPLYAHCHHVQNTGHELLDVLLENGAAPGQIAVGHATSRMEVPYLVSLLERGCYIALDQPHCHDGQRCVDTVAELCRLGYGARLLLSMDTPIYSDFENGAQVLKPLESYVARYGMLFETLLQGFREAGCSEEECRAVVRENALRYLQLR